ncbi:hypothetical protein ABZW03_20425 [Kitasatospora sp. NPDC004799]|uniref:hypothetical protein n=1 Tax=Kitasatospora sp. NPDC004799 TaxID=3154460 RepID=UPI0033AF087E
MPECAELCPPAVLPVPVLPLWRRGEAEGYRDADRPGVLRGHPGPVTAGRVGRSGQEGRAGAEPAG